MNEKTLKLLANIMVAALAVSILINFLCLFSVIPLKMCNVSFCIFTISVTAVNTANYFYRKKDPTPASSEDAQQPAAERSDKTKAVIVFVLLAVWFITYIACLFY